MSPPKLFVSYSWSSPEHEAWVLELATELRENGVDVVFDKWDLREGQDALDFMERMVSSPDISKVIMVCDEQYTKKANERKGGVGTETQIISPEIYKAQDQTKFVAVVRDVDAEGNPFLPIYYRSRIFIDFSRDESFPNRFEQLLRWIFDKPVHIKPPIGKPPTFFSSEEAKSNAVNSSFRRLISNAQDGATINTGRMDIFLDNLALELKNFEISQKIDNEYDEYVIKSIENWMPFRDMFIEFCFALAAYGEGDRIKDRVHSFFEEILLFTMRDERKSSWSEIERDNFKFIVHELWLYALSVFIKKGRFDFASVLINRPFFINHRDFNESNPQKFIVFREHMSSLAIRNQRLQTRRLSLRADLLKERSSGTGLKFDDLMQADFVAMIRGDLMSTEWGERWWPETLLYSIYHPRPVEIFVRGASRAYFHDKLLPLLGISSLADLSELFDRYSNGKAPVPKWEFDQVSPHKLANFNKLCTYD